MATIRVFSEENNQYYNVNVDFSLDIIIPEAPFKYDFNFKISTDMTTDSGSPLPFYNVRSFTDFPNNGQRAKGGTTPYASFTELMNDYILHYMILSGGYQSSSSSSSSSSIDSSSSSSSSIDSSSSSSSSTSMSSSSSSSSSSP